MRLSLSQKLILNWGITMKESPVSPMCSLWIVIEINLYTYLNICMYVYIYIEFNSRITAQNRNRNSNSKLTTCHTKPFLVHESDSEYMHRNECQSISQPVNQSINQTQSAKSQSNQSAIYIYISININININQSISSVHIVVYLIFSSYSRRILHTLVFSLDIYNIII